MKKLWLAVAAVVCVTATGCTPTPPPQDDSVFEQNLRVQNLIFSLSDLLLDHQSPTETELLSSNETNVKDLTGNLRATTHEYIPQAFANLVGDAYSHAFGLLRALTYGNGNEEFNDKTFFLSSETYENEVYYSSPVCVEYYDDESTLRVDFDNLHVLASASETQPYFLVYGCETRFFRGSAFFFEMQTPTAELSYSRATLPIAEEIDALIEAVDECELEFPTRPFTLLMEKYHEPLSQALDVDYDSDNDMHVADYPFASGALSPEGLSRTYWNAHFSSGANAVEEYTLVRNILTAVDVPTFPTYFRVPDGVERLSSLGITDCTMYETVSEFYAIYVPISVTSVWTAAFAYATCDMIFFESEQMTEATMDIWLAAKHYNPDCEAYYAGSYEEVHGILLPKVYAPRVELPA